jgi:hypothetical protein
LINAELIKTGFELSRAKPCLFVKYTTNIILLVYVDNIVTTSKSKIQLQQFFKTQFTRLKAKNLKEIRKIISARVIHDRKNQILDFNQEQYYITILNRFEIIAAKHKSKNIPTAH